MLISFTIRHPSLAVKTTDSATSSPLPTLNITRCLFTAMCCQNVFIQTNNIEIINHACAQHFVRRHPSQAEKLRIDSKYLIEVLLSAYFGSHLAILHYV